MTGIAGAPKFGDKAAWAPRIKDGVDALHASALKGKGAMPPERRQRRAVRRRSGGGSRLHGECGEVVALKAALAKCAIRVSLRRSNRGLDLLLP